ncbi:hypothetical protein [Streptomyces angustmyceticus]|uniref:hypothetical protein n=1 Tax=Streptomyces angustmyceticus TaxID=285578 RepID=UPI003D8A7DB2
MTATPPPPENPPTVHLPVQATGPAVSGTVIPSSAWPFRPGLPSTSSTPPSTAPAPVSTPAPAAGGSSSWLWRLPPTPPAPPGGGGMTPRSPASEPDPWSGGPGVPLDIRIEFVQPEPPKVSFWRRLWNVVTRGISPYAAWGALAAAVIPIPYVGAGVGALWGSVLAEIGTWNLGGLRLIAIPNVIGLGALFLTYRTLVLRPGAVRFFFFAVTAIGATTGVLWQDVVAAMTGVRA